MISKTIRTALKTQLSASGSGLNDRITALAPAYGVDAYQIDFGDTSVNFIFGQVDPDAFEESSVFTYPLCTIDTASAQDTGLIYSSTFSGPVVALIDLHHSWPDEAVLSDFSSLVDMTEDALISCLKDTAHQNWSAYGNLLLRKGGVSAQRGAVQFGKAQNWRQRLRLVCIFELAV